METCPSLAAASIFGTRAFFMGDTNSISYGGKRVERIFLRGVEPSYAESIPLFSVERGRFITRYDEEHSRNWSSSWVTICLTRSSPMSIRWARWYVSMD